MPDTCILSTYLNGTFQKVSTTATDPCLSETHPSTVTVRRRVSKQVLIFNLCCGQNGLPDVLRITANALQTRRASTFQDLLEQLNKKIH